jgi:hypothetical protein
MISDNSKIGRPLPQLGGKRPPSEPTQEATAEPQDQWSRVSTNSIGVVLYQLGNQPRNTEVTTSSFNDFRQDLIATSGLSTYASHKAVQTGLHVEESKKTFGKAALSALAAAGLGVACTAAMPVFLGIALATGAGALLTGSIMLGAEGWDQRTNPQNKIEHELDSGLAKVDTPTGTQFVQYYLMDGQYVAHGRPYPIQTYGESPDHPSNAERIRETPNLSEIKGYNSETHFSAEQCKPEPVTRSLRQY